MKLNNLILLPLITVAFTGCISLDLSKEVETPKESKKVVKKVITQRPLIVVNNVPKYDNVVDMGQYAEAWIAPYKDKYNNLYNKRNINFWVKEPDFIIGENLPTRRDSFITDSDMKHIPFHLKKLNETITEVPSKKIKLEQNVINFLNNESGDKK